MVDAQLQQQMTLDDYLALPESNQPMEFIYGEIIMVPAPTDAHQSFVGDIYLWLRQNIPNGEIRLAPLDVEIGGHVLQPDIFWAREGGECMVVNGRYRQGAPDLIVKILSLSTEKKDRGVKYEIYEQNGVGEYWLVSPSAEYVEVYLHDGEKFMRQGIYGKDDTFMSGILSVEVAIKNLFGEDA